MAYYAVDQTSEYDAMDGYNIYKYGSKGNKRHGRQRAALEVKEQRVIESGILQNIKREIPLSQCHHCEGKADKRTKESDEPEQTSENHHKGGFDENGYPIKHPSSKNHVPTIEKAKDTPSKPFRFLDLPAELRNRIYGFAFATDDEIVCISDALLRPLTVELAPRTCYEVYHCTICDFHENMNTMGGSGIARASRQLHDETILFPFTITTFSVHSLYYLNIFLSMIFPEGRKALRSLRFDWKLPEEEAQALCLRTDLKETFDLLDECANLTSLDVDMHVLNLCAWTSGGNQRAMMLDRIDEIPQLWRLAYVPRGLKKASLGFSEEGGVFGMVDWAKKVMARWAMPWGTDYNTEANPVEVVVEKGTGSWKRVRWSKAAVEEDEE